MLEDSTASVVTKENLKSKHDPSKIPTCVILSGVESDRYWDIVVKQCESKTVLMSYHYLKGKSKDFLRKRLEETPDVRVFVDSGAYTFITQADKYIDKPMSYWEDYLEEYTDWLKENADCIFACADLDLDDIVGSDQVEEWRANIFKPLTRDYGIDVCYIWHTIRGHEGWKRMCERYDYVGFSTENSDMTVQEMTKFVNIAKKNNARVHGMALTKTDILVRVPFFSADSTTWIVGQQYGELNWFDGRGMKRLSKQEWRTTYKTRLIKAPFFADWDKLINGMGGRGDTYELLRLNVLAYHLAEDHIRKRLRTKMYWLRENGAVVSEPKSESEIVLPDMDWFDEGFQEDYKYYLKELNLDPEMPKDEAVELIFSFFTYIKGDDELLDTIPDQMLLDYCKAILDIETEDREEALSHIKQYYIENATGVRHDFSDPMEGEAPPAPKERARYVEDDDFMVIDVDSDDLAGFLPAPKDNSMPEVEAYDEELRKMDIVPVRDSNGRFIKGQQKVRKPKKIYSDKMPKLACDTCYKAGDCEQYRAGFVCAFDKQFSKFNTRDANDIVDAMAGIADESLGRLQRAIMFEKMDGGMATGDVTTLIDQNMRLLKQMSELNNTRATISQKTVFKEDGTHETVTKMNVNPQGGGILSKIFGMASAGATDIEDEEHIDAEYEEVKE